MSGDEPSNLAIFAAIDETMEQALLRRCQTLQARLAEQTRVLAEAARELSAEIHRREEAQSALVQSQKLQAFGQMTSGIAHDFNNVMQAIRGSFDELAEMTDDPELLLVIENGQHAARSADSLTRQLLTHVRRGTAEIAPHAAEQVLFGVKDLIRRLIDPSIRCQFIADPGVWPVLVPIAELESVLLNLAINGRDAMPGGGQLSLSVGNRSLDEDNPDGLFAGDYVTFTVSDTGTGMSAEVLARATEAFFTTKGPERGTGLGLAMANSFARRMGGALTLQSVEGRGTIVEVILPRGPDQEQSHEVAHFEGSRGGIVLLVDENEASRSRLARLLRDLDYRVIEASNPQVALALSYSVPSLDLVLASATLPDGGSSTLTLRLRIERPSLPVLTIGAAIVRSGGLSRFCSATDLAVALQNALVDRLDLIGREESLSARMIGRLKDDRLRSCLETWRSMRGGQVLPRIDDAYVILGPVSGNHFVAAVDDTSSPPRFRFVSLGEELSKIMGGTIEQRSFSGPMAEEITTLEGVYTQTTRSRLPVYNWLRYALSDGAPMLFQRLILPMSEDGTAITHLMGIVLFSNHQQS